VRCASVSGFAMPPEVQRGLDAGFDHYLVKPVGFEDVRAQVAAALPRANSLTSDL